MVICKKCLEDKSEDRFYKSSLPKYINHGVCKTCIAELYKIEKSKVEYYLETDKTSTIECFGCGYSFPFKAFAPSDIANSKIGFKAVCRNCRNAYARDRYRKQKAKRKLEKLMEELI